MQRSTYRILTTHTGSLPRPDDLIEMLMARSAAICTTYRLPHARARSHRRVCPYAARHWPGHH